VATTVIGQGITIEGEVTSDDEVVIGGVLRGKLATEGPVTVEENGVVEADIGAQSVSIGGIVTGNVTAADRVELLTGGKLVGDVKTARLTIADGAMFKGNVDMDV
jgi:cytoskeletal protein CcmA (bactofilin family)